MTLIASEISEAIIMFSTGKDSIALLDLCCKYMDPSRLKIVHLYFVRGLSWRENLFRHYENRYSITIKQYPQVDVASIYKSKSFSAVNREVKKLTQPEMDRFLRKEFNTSWMMYGYKKTDSLSRRGIISKLGNGIDYRNYKAYPLADWNEKDVFNYCKREKLPLPADYNMNFRDVNFFHGNSLKWVYNNYPDDYNKIVATYPFIEAEYIRNEKQA